MAFDVRKSSGITVGKRGKVYDTSFDVRNSLITGAEKTDPKGPTGQRSGYSETDDQGVERLAHTTEVPDRHQSFYVGENAIQSGPPVGNPTKAYSSAMAYGNPPVADQHYGEYKDALRTQLGWTDEQIDAYLETYGDVHTNDWDYSGPVELPKFALTEDGNLVVDQEDARTKRAEANKKKYGDVMKDVKGSEELSGYYKTAYLDRETANKLIGRIEKEGYQDPALQDEVNAFLADYGMQASPDEDSAISYLYRIAQGKADSQIAAARSLLDWSEGTDTQKRDAEAESRRTGYVERARELWETSDPSLYKSEDEDAVAWRKEMDALAAQAGVDPVDWTSADVGGEVSRMMQGIEFRGTEADREQLNSVSWDNVYAWDYAVRDQAERQAKAKKAEDDYKAMMAEELSAIEADPESGTPYPYLSQQMYGMGMYVMSNGAPIPGTPEQQDLYWMVYGYGLPEDQRTGVGYAYTGTYSQSLKGNAYEQYAKFMTDDQRAVFYKKYRENPQDAVDWFESIKDRLMRQSYGSVIYDEKGNVVSATGRAGENLEFAQKHPWLASGWSVIQKMASSYTGLASMIAAFVDDTDAAYALSASAYDADTTRQAVAHDLSMKYGSDAAYWYNIGGSLIDNGAQMLTTLGIPGGKASKFCEFMVTTLMASEAGASAIAQGLAEGRSARDTSLLALADFCGEWFSEQIKIKGLYTDSTTNPFVYFVKNGLSEAIEEPASNWISRFLGNVFLGKEYELYQLYESYIAHDYTPQDAFTMCLESCVGEDMESALAGLVSGGVFGGMGAARGIYTNYQTLKADARINGDQRVRADSLNKALPEEWRTDFAGAETGDDYLAMVQRQAGRYRADQAARLEQITAYQTAQQEQPAAQQDLDAKRKAWADANRLMADRMMSVNEMSDEAGIAGGETAEAAPDAETMAEIERLNETLPEGERVDTTVGNGRTVGQVISDLVAKLESAAADAQARLDSLNAALERGPGDTNAAPAAAQNAPTAPSPAAETAGQQSTGKSELRGKMREAGSDMRAQGEQDQQGQQKPVTQQDEDEKRAAELEEIRKQLEKGRQDAENVEGKAVAGRFGYLDDKSTGRAGGTVTRKDTGESADIAGIKKGADGSLQIDLKKPDGTTETVAAADVDMSGDPALETIISFSSRYGAAAGAVYDAYKASGMTVAQFASDMQVAETYADAGLTEQQAIARGESLGISAPVIRTGYIAAQTNRAATDVRRARRAARQYNTVMRNAAGGETTSNLTDFLDGHTISSERADALKLADALVRSAGWNVRFTESTVDADGMRVGKNGTFDHSTNTVTLDAYAGNMDAKDNRVLIYNALLHEVTHAVRAASAQEDWTAFKNWVISSGITSDAALVDDINEKANKYMRGVEKGGRGLSRQDALDLAEEEAVAEACEKVRISDENLAALQRDNPTLWKKVTQTIKDFIARIRSVVDKLRNAAGDEPKLWADALEKQADELDRRWNELFAKARENIRAAQAQAPSGLSGDTTTMSYEDAAELSENAEAYERDLGVTPDTARAMVDGGYEKPDNGMNSVRTMDKFLRALMKADIGSYTEQDRLDAAALVKSITEQILTDAVSRDYVQHGTSAGSPLRSNIEYVVTFDLDAICPRTYRFGLYRDTIENKLGRRLSEVEARTLIENLRAAHEMIPCTYCYVESKRMALSEAFNRFFKLRSDIMNAASYEDALKYVPETAYNHKTGEWKNNSKGWQDRIAAFRSSAEHGEIQLDRTTAFESFQSAERMIYDYLDRKYGDDPKNYKTDKKTARTIDGKEHAYTDFKLPVSQKIMLNDVCREFGIPVRYETVKAGARGAQLEIEKMALQWLNDKLANRPHNVNAEAKTEQYGVNLDALDVIHEALSYAASSSQAHGRDNYSPYADHIFNIVKKKKKGVGTVYDYTIKDNINAHGGIRVHSSNDFTLENVVDYIQFFTHLAFDKSGGQGWMSHAYTKSELYVKFFGKTGQRINMSIAMRGDFKSGITQNADEGMDWNAARNLRNRDCGVMAMVTNDDQLSFALNSEWIDMIIPFHASGMPTYLYRDIMAWFDYTSVQNDVLLTDEQLEERYGKGYQPIRSYWSYNADKDTWVQKDEPQKIHLLPGDQYRGGLTKQQVTPENRQQLIQEGKLIEGHNNSAERYLELCKQYGLKPRFEGTMVQTADGRTVDITQHPNYVKVLKETAKTDTAQREVTANFNVAEILDQVKKGSNPELRISKTGADFDAFVNDFLTNVIGQDRAPGFVTAENAMYKFAAPPATLDDLTKEIYQEAAQIVNDDIRRGVEGYTIQELNDLLERAAIRQREESADTAKRVADIEALARDRMSGSEIRNSERTTTPRTSLMVDDDDAPIRMTYDQISDIREANDTDVRYSVRREDPPKKTKTGYKAFYVKNGYLFPPMVQNPQGHGTPVGVWLNADTGTPIFNDDGTVAVNKSGRAKVKQGGTGTKGGSGALAWRPGWHLGPVPDATQFWVQDPDAGEDVHKLNPDIVFAEVEFAADVDYQLEAYELGMKANGKFDHSQAGIPYIIKDGYYRYRTNSMIDGTRSWYISGAMKVTRILTDAECREICADNGVDMMPRLGGDFDFEKHNLAPGVVTPSDVSDAPDGQDYSNSVKVLPGYSRRALNFDDPNLIAAFRNDEIEDQLDYYKDLYAKTDGRSLTSKGLQYTVDDEVRNSERVRRINNPNIRADYNEIQNGLDDMLAQKKARDAKAVEDKIRQEERIRSQIAITDALDRERATVSVSNTVNALRKMFRDNNKNNHIPTVLKKPVFELVSAMKVPGDVRTKRAAKELAAALDRISNVLNREIRSQEDPNAAPTPTEEAVQSPEAFEGYIDMPQEAADMFSDIAEQLREVADTTRGGDVSFMTTDMVQSLDQALKIMYGAVNKANRLIDNTRYRTVESAAKESYNFLKKQHGKAGNRGHGALHTLLFWKNATPITVFERFGEAGKSVFAELMDGQDRLARRNEEVKQMAASLFTPEQARAWDNNVREFKLMPADGDEEVTVRITDAQLMSLYALSKRPQGLQHIQKGGIRIGTIGEGRKAMTDTTHYLITTDQLNEMIGKLSKEQKEAVDGMVKYMSTTLGEWGNEVTLKRFGVRFYTEGNYFPIKTDDAMRPIKGTDKTSGGLYRLLNMSFTQSLNAKASNALILDSVTKVFSEHAADMALYSTMALPALDVLKWANYRQRYTREDADGNKRPVQISLVKEANRVYGEQAMDYVTQLIKSINGTDVKERDTGLLNKFIGKFKVAAVGANLSVAALQPISYIRAADVIAPQYLAKAIRSKPQIQRMREVTGIGMWKASGNRDFNTSRSLSAEIRGDNTRIERIQELSLRAAEKMDSLTWGYLFNAVEYELMDRAARGEITAKQGTQEWDDALNERFREIVYKTQVVDSVLTRSDIMRNQSGLMKLLTAFKSEPTVTANMILSHAFGALQDHYNGMSAREIIAKRGKGMARTLTVYAALGLTEAFVRSAIGAFRDDDDYETYWEKLTQQLGSQALAQLNPLDLVPVISQVYEAMFLGEEQTITGFNAFTTIYEVGNTVFKILNGTYSGTDYKAAYKLAQAVSYATGIPFSAAMREAVAGWNTFCDTASLQNLKLQTASDSKKAGTDALYDALASGDKARAADLRRQLDANKVTEDTINTNLRKNIKADYMAGDISDTEAQRRLVEFTGMSKDKAWFQAQSYDFDMVGWGSFADADVVVNGALKNSARSAMDQYILHSGKTEKQAVSAVWQRVRTLLQKGRLTDSEAVKVLTSACGYSQREAEEKVTEWKKGK